MIRWKQEATGLPDFGMTYGNPDFVELADSFGAQGVRLEEGDDLRTLLQEAYEHGGVVLIDCPIDYTPNRELSEDRDAEIVALLKE
jgi:acetolactate synthase-1/2/3 large subunit